jgi:hypothetical protein
MAGGSIKVWGQNPFGALGIGPVGEKLSPVNASIGSGV